MAPKTCPQCGSARIETDVSMGQAVCMNCFAIVDDNILVAEVGFAEGSGGRVHVQGTFVAHSATGFGGRGGQDSLEKTKAHGKERIRRTAESMGIEAMIWRQAQRYFSLLVDSKFNKGRRSEYLVASCLYLSCRMNKSDKMMIDFSERLAINVFELGATYMKLRAALELKQPIPEVDPAIYNIRFAHKLDFGTAHVKQIAADATRLVRRFRADWMTQGRRPAGVCGACLIIAARMSSFWRSPEEVAQVVKVSAITIKKRLIEFARTEMGSKTVKEWREMDETEVDMATGRDLPPIVKEHKRRERIRVEREAMQRLRDQGAELDEDGEVFPGDEDDEADDAEERPKKRAKNAKGKRSKAQEMREGRGLGEVEADFDADGAIQAAAENYRDDDLDGEDNDATLAAMEQADFVSELNEARDNPEQVKRDIAAAARSFKRLTKRLQEEGAEEEGKDDEVDRKAEKEEAKDDDDLADFEGLSDVPDEFDEEEPREEVEEEGVEIEFNDWDDNDKVIKFVGERYFKDEIDLYKLTESEIHERVSGWLRDRDPKEVITDLQVIENARKERERYAKKVRLDDFTDLDDEEFDKMWRFEVDDPAQREEQLMRTRMWMSANGAWYEGHLERRAREAEKEKAQGTSEKKNKKKRKAPHRGPYNSAREAIENIASTKKFSTRINYGALNLAMDGEGEDGLQAFEDEKHDEKYDDDPDNW